MFHAKYVSVCSHFYNLRLLMSDSFAASINYQIIMKKNTIILTAFLLVLFEGNTFAQNLNAIKQSIIKTNALYFELFSKKDLSIVNLYDEDGVLMSPNGPAIRGKAALTKDFKQAYASQIKGVKFATQNIYGDGSNYVTEEGTWQVFDTSGKELDNGKYLKLWKKVGNSWKIFRDVFNSDRKGSN